MNRWRALCFASLIVASRAWSAGLEYSSVSPAPAQIDDFLARKNSLLSGIGGSLVGFARDYNIDPRLVVAIAGAETTFGQHLCAANNAWNWFHGGNCPSSPFQSYQEGAEHVTKYLRLSYLNRGYETIEQIRFKYCAAGCDNWIPLVTSFYNAMPANGSSSGTTPAPVQATQPPPQAQSPQPTQTPTAPATQAPDDDTIFGVPRYLAFLLGALLLGAWAFSSLKR